MVKREINKYKQDFDKKMAKNIKSDPKTFYAYIRSKQKTRPTVGPLKREDNSIIDSDNEAATVMNEYFTSVFTQENIDNIPEDKIMYHGPEENKLMEIDFSEEAVLYQLNRLKENKAPGPDGLYPKILKEAGAEIVTPLHTIFHRSLNEGQVPQQWRDANITCIHKKGRKSLPTNYRPVSLTSIVCKMLETIIKEHILLHLDQHDLIKDSQHGFLRGKSTLTNLLVYLEDITKHIDYGTPVDVVYLDFAKAFDKVPHTRLIRKLRNHGIDGNILNWIHSWLSGRRQRVIINGQASEYTSVVSGVPQGSVLGPILFILFINDMDEDIKGNLLKFADDTKLYTDIKDNQSANTLQDDLDKLQKWTEDWNMAFNLPKCGIMHLGYGNPLNDYYLNGTVLNKIDKEKDLGIIIQNNLKTSQQCIEAVKKANRSLGLIKRNIQTKTPEIITRLYKSIVRPHLEYAVQAWSPWLRKDIDAIEKVQKSATKMIDGLRQLPYQDRLRKLNLTSLEQRRIRGDLIQVCKIVNNIDKLNYEKFFKLSNQPHFTRGHIMKMDKPRARLDVRKNFFSHRVINEWNKLPPRAACASTVLDFKIAYDAKAVRDGRADNGLNVS
jgi:hypothetical protein